MRKFSIKQGIPYPLGATAVDGGINFSMVNSSDKECGIILYKRNGDIKERIKFNASHRIGNIFCLIAEGIPAMGLEYNFYIGEDIFVDPYAKRIVGNEKWRGGELARPILRGGIYSGEFDWGDTKTLHIPYQDTIMYCMHLRGFTKHSSSHVKCRGTFMGLVEKIPYLKELGVNSIELMPVYEFEECERRTAKPKNTDIEYQVQHFDEPIIADNAGEECTGINYWGYKEAYYFAPKASYAYGDDACAEFKTMVRALHENGIELVLQFYFPDSVKQGYILEILKHWVLEYRIDGIHLKGDKIPVTLIATEPLFANTKLMYEYFTLQDIYPTADAPIFRNLGYYRDEFMVDCRRYLKGDQDMLKSFQYHMKNHNIQCGVINYITNYYGFTLNDMVSYERKHNEANGEYNCDGTNYNYSWNCGAEGSTRKKSILQLRKKQMKNAMTLLMTAQGTPLFMAGDEFGNSQNGNNNSYCQDNETGWVNWKGLDKNTALFEYTKQLIAFRKSHNILHLETRLSMLDQFKMGYPDLSYHGDEAWKLNTDAYNRHIGIMYCGENGGQKDLIYIAYNMHWEKHKFALPSIAGYRWQVCMETDDAHTTQISNDEALKDARYIDYIEVNPRSIVIMTCSKIIRTKAGKH